MCYRKIRNSMNLRSVNLACFALTSIFQLLASVPAAEPLLQLPLKNDARDAGPLKLEARAADVRFESESAQTGKKGSLATWNGRTSQVEIIRDDRLAVRRGPFTVMARIDLTGSDDDLPGDIVNQFDHETGRGWMLSITSRSGLVHSRSNHRQIHFGVRNGDFDTPWTDHGRPGGSVYVQAMTVFDGSLYVGICDPSPTGKGGVFRFVPPDRWEDCRLPITCNSVTSLTVHQGRLHAGSGKYRLAGSALAESDNPQLGGEVFRMEPYGSWKNLGRLGESEAVGGLVVFQGRLHASSLYKPAGFFRLEDTGQWTTLDTPGGKRPEALAVHNDLLYATGYDEGHVYRYDGKSWTDLGAVGKNTQTYGFAVYRGALYVSTWPEGKVYRLEEPAAWVDCGRLGEELEVMGMAVHGGSLFGGTLPTGTVYRYQGGTRWIPAGNTDRTPDVKYRRAWSFAEFGGRLYCGTLPSGRVWSNEAGANVTYDRELADGLHHVAAVREGATLVLYLDGKEVARRKSSEAEPFDLAPDASIRVGYGVHDSFRGQLGDVRLYRGALTPKDIRAIADEKP
ncbi:hypothetical protein GC170_17765 [bacterium]|nr:hypothetical protein [bacterium]